MANRWERKAQEDALNREQESVQPDPLAGLALPGQDMAMRAAEEQAQPMQPAQQTGTELPMGAAPGGGGFVPGMLGTYARKLTQEDVERALRKLHKYRDGKHSVDRRVISSQQWWKLRNWDEIRRDKGERMDTGSTAKRNPNSAWLWNCIVGKHADAMASFPEPLVLPRMQDDKEVAKKLSDIVPMVLQQNDFEEVYSDVMWQKMLEGTGVFGVYWDKTRNGGLGDVAIKQVDILNLCWEPGVKDIQDSPDLFCIALVDNDQIEAEWPQMRDKEKHANFAVAQYMADDTIDTSDKSLVVDWYYKRQRDGKTILHYAKLCGGEVLFASEEDEQMAQEGYYTDGMYPFVLDRLFPVQGAPSGYGYIDIGKDTQETIDRLNAAITQNAIMSATPRYFLNNAGSVNKEEFLDWTKPFVHADGNLGQDTLLPITVTPLNSNAMSQLQASIEELKFITGNSDVNNGQNPSGVTAASALAALQESAGRSSKDQSKSAYRAYARLVTMVIERIRQFYDVPRTFRILGQTGEEAYVQMGADEIRPQSQGIDFGEDFGYRLPVFDIEVRAQKENPYSRMSQNELALQLYGNGFFNPQMSDQAMMALDMMDFNGKYELMQKVQRNGTMQEMMLQFAGIAHELALQTGDTALAQQLEGILAQMGMGDAAGMQEGNSEQLGDVRTEDEKRSDTVQANARERYENSTTL